MLNDNDNEIIVTIRLIRSFHHRNIRNFVIHNVDKSILVKELKERIITGWQHRC